MTAIEDFIYYLNERENIRLRKERGEEPLTEDPIFQKYKFTNILRENDRTTRWVKKNWYDPNRDKPLDIQALNCGIFRYFGTIEFAEEIGYQETWDPNFIIKSASDRRANKKKVFTGAYIITNGGISAPKEQVVVGNYLQPFREHLDEIVKIARETRSWQSVGEVLMKLPGMGAFMSKEILLDMLLTPVLEDADDRYTWSPAGPGAIRGLNRIHGREVNKALTQGKALNEMKDLMADVQAIGVADYMPKLGTEFGITDIQFCLCEYDKYQRVKLGEGRPRSTYKPSAEPLP